MSDIKFYKKIKIKKKVVNPNFEKKLIKRPSKRPLKQNFNVFFKDIAFFVKKQRKKFEDDLFLKKCFIQKTRIFFPFTSRWQKIQWIHARSILKPPSSSNMIKFPITTIIHLFYSLIIKMYSKRYIPERHYKSCFSF